jgi:DNA-binding MarR family transcriptional regulator
MNMDADDEVAVKPLNLSQDDIRSAVRLLQILTTAQPSEEAENDQLGGGNLLPVAKFSLLARQSRTAHFARSMFGEPAWDLLLAIYVSEATDRPPTVTDAANMADIPLSTVSRWIQFLEERGLIDRRRSGKDGRASIVTLSKQGRASLEAYFVDLLARMAASHL